MTSDIQLNPISLNSVEKQNEWSQTLCNIRGLIHSHGSNDYLEPNDPCIYITRWDLSLESLTCITSFPLNCLSIITMDFSLMDVSPSSQWRDNWEGNWLYKSAPLKCNIQNLSSPQFGFSILGDFVNHPVGDNRILRIILAWTLYFSLLCTRIPAQGPYWRRSIHLYWMISVPSWALSMPCQVHYILTISYSWIHYPSSSPHLLSMPTLGFYSSLLI